MPKKISIWHFSKAIIFFWILIIFFSKNILLIDLEILRKIKTAEKIKSS